MKITFNVGDNETHSVEFSWGQMLGTSRIRVDGQVVFRGRPVSLDEVALLANLPKYVCEIVANREVPWQRIRRWDFELGETEKHHIRIEKERPKFCAGFRPHEYRVYIDGDLVMERCGY